MKKHSKRQTTQTARPTFKALKAETGYTVGLDVSDEYTQAAVVGAGGRMLWEGRLRTREPELRRWLSGLEPCTVALETGTHSRWIARAVRGCGHEALVADARELRLIYGGHNKTDRLDAEKLARLARVDWKLLHPVEQRSDSEHADLAVIAARDLVVRMRTGAINAVRGMVKASGARVPKCSAESFTAQAGPVLPEPLRKALGPVLEEIDSLNEKIREYDEQLEHLARTKYPETELLRQVAGVGVVTALAFRLTIGDGQRFRRSRDVGCYVGLRPKRDQSGEQDLQLGISKAGNPLLRRLLVNCAHHILGFRGEDSDLRRWGLALAARGGKNGKKRAVVAVARKLAVLLHRLWVSGEVYEALRNSRRRGRAAA